MFSVYRKQRILVDRGVYAKQVLLAAMCGRRAASALTLAGFDLKR